MTVKFKLLLIWVFILVVIGFAAHHFLNGTDCGIQNLIAMEVAFLPSIAKLGVLIYCSHL